MSTDQMQHLAAKKRGLGDLIQFVKTRTANVPNYVLLLGAGASATSGVRTAGELVEEWRKDLYERYCAAPVMPYSTDAARDFFTREHARWYSPQREYVSLFERKFDLPRQRRMFVEQEVDGKQPSIGYAYLTRLIDDGFFNAIFTTNFDDLLNEAFHQFSDTRPIVCAHDSSITSITVTSKRPKIIKIHGDYLFDDIKSTVKETESLEENTKRKFAEFSKDHGLIVVGYSGHDRSVMDVLHHLLKHDDYFKHGIYWCLRDGDKPSEELIKLLWRDRAYWVPVDGFDELTAQLYKECVGEALPINTALVSEKPKEIISRFCNDGQLQRSQSSVIRHDLERLDQELRREALVESLRQIARVEQQEDLATSDLTDRELIKLMAVRQLVRDRAYKKAIERISDELAQTSSQEFRSDLLTTRLGIESASGDYSAAVLTADLLHQEDPNNAYFLLKRAENERSHEKRMGTISKAIETDPYYPYAYRLRAKMCEEQLASDPFCNVDDLRLGITRDYETSISLDPSIGNSARGDLIHFLLEKEPRNAERDAKIDSLLSELRKLDAMSPTYLNLAVDAEVRRDNEKAGAVRVLDQIKDAIKRQPRNRKKRLEMAYLKALRKFNKTSELMSELATFDADEQWSEDGGYAEFRARVYAEVEGRIHEGIRRLESYRFHRKKRGCVSLLIQYYSYARRAEEAQKLLDESRDLLDPEMCDSLQEVVFSSVDEHEKVLGIARSRKGRALFATDMAVSETHALLKLSRNQDAEQVARAILEPAHFPRQLGYLILNMEIACQRQGRNVNKPRLNEVIDRNRSDDALCMGAYLLLEEKDKAAERLRRAVRDNRTYAFICYQSAIFSGASNRAWLTETLSKDGLDPGVLVQDLKRMVS